MPDKSFSSDWAYYRRFARFGLPHLRARMVRFFINGELQGYYTLLEAPDQEYVFAKSFPSYDPNHKFKSLDQDCGAYDPQTPRVCSDSRDLHACECL